MARPVSYLILDSSETKCRGWFTLGQQSTSELYLSPSLISHGSFKAKQKQVPTVENLGQNHPSESGAERSKQTS